MCALKIILVIVVILIIISGGVLLVFWYYVSSQRAEITNSIYNKEASSCSNNNDMSVEKCQEYVRCYSKNTVKEIKIMNLKRWIDETRYSQNPYYIVRGHLIQSNGLNDNYLDKIQDDCLKTIMNN
jgi:hypothetical protein